MPRRSGNTHSPSQSIATWPPHPPGSRGSSMHKRSAGIYLSWLSDSLSPNRSLKELSWTTGTGRSPWVRTWVFLFSDWNLGSFYSIGLKGAGRCKSADGLKNHPWGCESGDRTMKSFSWICTWGCQEEMVGDTQLIWSGRVYLYLENRLNPDEQIVVQWHSDPESGLWRWSPGSFSWDSCPQDPAVLLREVQDAWATMGRCSSSWAPSRQPALFTRTVSNEVSRRSQPLSSLTATLQQILGGNCLADPDQPMETREPDLLSSVSSSSSS